VTRSRYGETAASIPEHTNRSYPRPVRYVSDEVLASVSDGQIHVFTRGVDFDFDIRADSYAASFRTQAHKVLPLRLHVALRGQSVYVQALRVDESTGQA
jgi:hypothetical protein